LTTTTDAGAPIELDLIEGVPNREARLRYAAADVIVDQLKIGWYGMFAIESMALAKPVVVHLDEEAAAETEEAFELELPLGYTDFGGNRSRSGVAGLDLSLFHNLNVETGTLPALALRADVLFPVGALGPDRTYASLKGIATRTYSAARFHVNGQYTFGSRQDEQPTQLLSASGSAGGVEVSRWLAGIAVDKTFPLRAILLCTCVPKEKRPRARWRS